MATRSLNRVELIGNLTRDPELRYTPSGTAVCTFTVATNRTYTDSNNNTVETAEFTPVVAWGKLGEICSQLLSKGTKSYIEGRLQTSTWDDKETGEQMRKTEVVATEMLVLTSGGNNNNSSNNNTGEHHATSHYTPEATEMNQSLEDIDFDMNFGDGATGDAKSDTKKAEDKTDNKDLDSGSTPF